MSNLIEFKNIADEITIREDGVAILSIRAASRLAGIHHTSLARGGALRSQKLAEKFAGQGVDSGALATGQVTDEMLEVILSYYAFDAGHHCTEQAKYAYQQFAKTGIRTACYAAKGLVEVKPKAQQQPAKSQILSSTDLEVQQSQDQLAISSPVDEAKEMTGFVLQLLDGLEIGQTPQQDKSLKIGVAISAAQIYRPEIADALKPAQKLLAATTTTDGVYLTPTALGERIGLSAIKTNKLLIEMKLQTKVDNPAKGEPKYLPTQTGKAYSMMTMATGQYGDTTTYQHLKWSERVLGILGGAIAA